MAPLHRSLQDVSANKKEKKKKEKKKKKKKKEEEEDEEEEEEEEDPEEGSSTDPSEKRSVLDKLSATSVAALTTTPESLYASVTSLTSLTPDLPAKRSARSHTETSGQEEEPQESGLSASESRSRCCCPCPCPPKPPKRPKGPKRPGPSLGRSLRSLPMWALVAWQASGLLTGVLGPAFLPPLAREKGLSDREAASLLTLLGGLDIGSRLLPGVVAHYGLLKPHQMVVLTLVLQGVLCQVRWGEVR